MSKADLAQERKNQIINATIECITKYGYNNFSMQDVARIADVSKGIIHYYFLNKEDLMMAVLDRAAGDIEGLLININTQTSDPFERIRLLMKLCFNVVREKREYYCINMDFWTQINQKEKVRLAVAKHYAKFRQATSVVVQQGIDSGHFRAQDSNHTAAMIIALIDGLSLQWLFDESVFVYDDAIRSSEALVMSYLLPQK
jgi:AcrR family transcriptional regulator